MRFIVLGGAGDVGSRAVEELVLAPDVEQVTIADRNLEAARKLAERLDGGGTRVDAKSVDAMDHSALVEALRGYDVAASALGPFHVFEGRLVRAAIEAGVDYASVCDEWDAAEEIFDNYSEPARAAGRIILTGLGTSPGLTNVGIKRLAGKMDRVRRADICVFQPLNAGGGEAVFRHMLFVITGHTAIWRKRKRVLMPACREKRTIEFPRFGKVKLWNMGHAEPVTIPRFMPEIEDVNFYMGFGPGAEFFVLPARLGLFENENAVKATVGIIELLEKIMGGDKEPAEGAVRIDVWGETDGREDHRMLCGCGQMREVTGLSLALGALMLGRKELTATEPGVYAPEGCIEPGKFIEAVKARGLCFYEDLAMTCELG